jgi:hypothetical protein
MPMFTLRRMIRILSQNSHWTDQYDIRQTFLPLPVAFSVLSPGKYDHSPTNCEILQDSRIRLASVHPPKFQYAPSNPSNSGLRACTGTTTSSARIALVIPTNIVRLSIARNSSRSSAGTLVGTFVYQPLSLKPARATTGNSSPSPI